MTYVIRCNNYSVHLLHFNEFSISFAVKKYDINSVPYQGLFDINKSNIYSIKNCVNDNKGANSRKTLEQSLKTRTSNQNMILIYAKAHYK